MQILIQILEYGSCEIESHKTLKKIYFEITLKKKRTKKTIIKNNKIILKISNIIYYTRF